MTAATVGALSLALHLRDPHAAGSWGACPFKLLTGLDCPGCGCLRAVNELTRGDLVAAASSNLLLVLALPFAVTGWALWLRRQWIGAVAAPGPAGDRGRAAALVARVPAAGWWLAAAVVAVTFTVLRNSPWGSWLHS